MLQLFLREIIPHIKGRIVQGNQNLLITEVVKRPEKVQTNTLLFHMRKVDWSLYDFHESNAIITKKPADILAHVKNNVTIIQVPNMKAAYWGFVDFYRNLLTLPVIGVTGTCGKTTVTEMIKKILATNHQVSSTHDGRNSLARNLQYLTSIDDSTDVGVFEMGVGRPGDMTYHCRHFRPQVGVLLNIGVYHLAGCKTLNNYIRTKAELLAGMSPEGILIINGDDKNIKKIDLSPFKGKVVTFGLSENAVFRAKDIYYGQGGVFFKLCNGLKSYNFYVPGRGLHTVYNTLAAAAAVNAVGCSIKEAARQLASFRQLRHHLQFRAGPNGCTIIDDTWNVTPPSMKAALELFQNSARPEKKVAVLGYMPQLGESGHREYARIGRLVAKSGIDTLITIGEARQIAASAVANGFNKENVHLCHNGDDLYPVIIPYLSPDTTLLFKFPYHFKRPGSSLRIFMHKIFPPP